MQQIKSLMLPLAYLHCVVDQTVKQWTHLIMAQNLIAQAFFSLILLLACVYLPAIGVPMLS